MWSTLSVLLLPVCLVYDSQCRCFTVMSNIKGDVPLQLKCRIYSFHRHFEATLNSAI